MGADLLEADYQMAMNPKSLRDAIGRLLRRNKVRFLVNGGKWEVLGGRQSSTRFHHHHIAFRRNSG